MKLVIVALVCLLLAATCAQQTQRGSTVPSYCCYSFVRTRFPKRAIQCYRSISSSCPLKEGVIFLMRGNRELCASKTESWVEDYMKSLHPCS